MPILNSLGRFGGFGAWAFGVKGVKGVRALGIGLRVLGFDSRNGNLNAKTLDRKSPYLNSAPAALSAAVA